VTPRLLPLRTINARLDPRRLDARFGFAKQEPTSHKPELSEVVLGRRLGHPSADARSSREARAGLRRRDVHSMRSARGRWLLRHG
jgi:hypothetical protein